MHLQHAWEELQDNALGLHRLIWWVCVQHSPPSLFPSLPPKPSSTTTTTSEARGSLAALVIPQWMWVSTRGFAFVTQRGDRQRGRDPSHPGCTRTNAHTHAGVHTPMYEDKDPKRDAHTDTQVWLGEQLHRRKTTNTNFRQLQRIRNMWTLSDFITSMATLFMA